MQALLGGRLLGTGNVVRQLATLGFSLRFEQSALHEFDFSVGALAVDLRDGVRLCKLTEMLTGTKHLMISCMTCAITQGSPTKGPPHLVLHSIRAFGARLSPCQSMPPMRPTLKAVGY